MRKIFIQRLSSILSCLVCFLLINFSFTDKPKTTEISPVSLQTDTFLTTDFNLPLNWNLYYGDIDGLNYGTIGAAYYKGKYYINTWSLTHPVCYTIDAPSLSDVPNLNTLDSITYPQYVGEIRDMAIAPDGSGKEYLWGGKAGSTLFKMDSSLNVLSTISVSGGSFRGIAWDPNRKGFWNCNFAGNIICHDTLGNVKGVLTAGSAITGKYGIAWDSTSSADSAFLWVWCQPQGNTSNTLHKIHLTSGDITAVYEIKLSGNAVAGCANVIKSRDQSYLLLNFQSASLACFTLSGQSYSECGTTYSNDGLSKPIMDFATTYDTLNVQRFTRNPDYIKVILDTIHHSWVGDLTMILSHNGISDTLMDRPGRAFGSFGSNGKNFIGTILSDNGYISMDSLTSFMQPYTSPPYYKPGTHYGMDSLSKFMSTDLNGEWILSIKDNVGGDIGVLNSWGLCFGESSLNAQQNNTSPQDYILYQNYPNPFNPNTTIKYTLPENQFVTLKVYDITGKEIALLEETRKTAGNYEVQFSASNLASGVYFYSLTAGDIHFVKRMILLK